MAPAAQPAFVQNLEQLSGMAPIVDDDKATFDAGQPIDELCVAQHISPLRLHAAEPRIELTVRQNDLLNVLERFWRREARALRQGRLRGRAQHDARAIATGKFAERCQTGPQQPEREGLRFIQNHDGTRDVVQFAAA